MPEPGQPEVNVNVEVTPPAPEPEPPAPPPSPQPLSREETAAIVRECVRQEVGSLLGERMGDLPRLMDVCGELLTEAAEDMQALEVENEEPEEPEEPEAPPATEVEPEPIAPPQPPPQPGPAPAAPKKHGLLVALDRIWLGHPK